jgi:hypothetical protein
VFCSHRVLNITPPQVSVWVFIRKSDNGYKKARFPYVIYMAGYQGPTDDNMRVKTRGLCVRCQMFRYFSSNSKVLMKANEKAVQLITKFRGDIVQF